MMDSVLAPPDQRLWADLHERMRAFVGRRVRDPHSADDVAQDVLLRLHRSLGDLRADDRLDAFAYRVARNAIVDHYRSRAAAKEVPAAPEDLAERIGAEPETAEARGVHELAGCLRPLVDRLPDPYRDALTLTDLGDLSQVQAAKRSGLSVPGMKARVQRGRRQLRELLAECCEVALDEASGVTEIQRKRSCGCGPGESCG
jgi:RNA polymerase sigma-70 factor, ECF subfamily